MSLPSTLLPVPGFAEAAATLPEQKGAPRRRKAPFSVDGNAYFTDTYEYALVVLRWSLSEW